MGDSDPVVDAARGLLDDLMPILKESCPGEQDERLEVTGWPARWVAEAEVHPSIPRRFKAKEVASSRGHPKGNWANPWVQAVNKASEEALSLVNPLVS
jgi:hypothetical protein